MRDWVLGGCNNAEFGLNGPSGIGTGTGQYEINGIRLYITISLKSV